MNRKWINFSLLVLLALRLFYKFKKKQHKYFYNTIYFATSLLKLAESANCSPTSPCIFPQSVFLSLFKLIYLPIIYFLNGKFHLLCIWRSVLTYLVKAWLRHFCFRNLRPNILLVPFCQSPLIRQFLSIRKPATEHEQERSENENIRLRRRLIFRRMCFKLDKGDGSV